MKPNFFLIGAPKCGTTALAEYLASRDDVFFSTPKEPLFWCDDLGVEPHALRFSTIDEYMNLFSDARDGTHIVVGEGTTAYLRSPSAVRKINKAIPDAKFVAILRNPVDVAHAYHMEQRFTGLEKEASFAAAWADQENREKQWYMSKDGSPDSLLYRQIALFSTQVERLFNEIPENRRLVLIYDDFKENPRLVWLKLLEFLELPDDGRVEFSKKNSAHAQRFPRLSHFLLAPPSYIAPTVRALRISLLGSKNPIVRALKSMLNVSRPREQLDCALRQEMVSYFESDIDKLSNLLERDLSQWKEV